MSLRLQFAAISDVGRVRKDNQDSGYAGPWLLAVCDGVGGAARGDIASGTAVQELRQLDEPPGDTDLLDRLAAEIEAAQARIGHLVDDDPGLNGTSTTATVAVFDGRRVGIGHVGDSRAYLYRDGELSQLTTDHTFVQTLVDEGRITPAEARTHPHRNLILKALDGVHDVEPDLFPLEVVAGDRLFLCSDGACGVLDDARIADVLSMGTPDYAAVELVRASLEAGSSDNVTCLVADVVDADHEAAAGAEDGQPDAEVTREQVVVPEPMLVGAAAELRRRPGLGAVGSLFRGHRSGDTGEMEPIDAEIPDDIEWVIDSDPEVVRYAPRPPGRFVWLKRLLVLAVVVGLVWVIAAGAYSWSQRQYYVGHQDGRVVIFRGVDAHLPGITLSEPYLESDVELDRLSEVDQDRVLDGIGVDDLDAARETVDELASLQQDEPQPAPSPSPGEDDEVTT